MSSETRSPGGPAGLESEIYDTANDRFKRSFGAWFWGSMLAATLVHFAVMAFWPDLEASDLAFVMDEIEAIELPPEIEIPPPPEQIQRPAEPVITDAQIDEDITIAPTTFEDNPMEDLPPPPTQGGVDISEQPTFTPYEVEPELRNPREVQQALVREYPSILRDAGIGGVVEVWFFIDENGEVQNAQVNQSSGHESLDAAAERVAYAFRFSPALNRDQPVPVWVSIPIRFQTH